MDRFLLVLGFQLVDGAFLLALDGSAWHSFRDQGWEGLRASLNPDALGLLVETVISGTWLGRLAESAAYITVLARGAGQMPVIAISGQIALVCLWIVIERRLLQSRLDRMSGKSL